MKYNLLMLSRHLDNELKVSKKWVIQSLLVKDNRSD